MKRAALLRDLAARIVAVARPRPTRVAIDGVDGAGKTTLADELAPAVERLGRPVVRASIDGFHRPAAMRRRRGSVSPAGYLHDSFDHPALLDALLRPLGPGGSLALRRAVFDFRTDRRVDPPLEHAGPDAVLLFDGVFLLRPELRDDFDFSIFVRTCFDVTVERAVRRDARLFGSPEEARRLYEEPYVPGQRLYLATVRPERWASVVLDNDDPARPVVVEAR